MTVEFVEPEPVAPAPVAPFGTVHGSPDGVHPAAPPATTSSGRLGRLPAAGWLVAAALAGAGTLPTLYSYRETTSIPDFDHVDYRMVRLDVDAWGHATAVPRAGISTNLGPGYAPLWWVLAGVLAVVAVWGLLRPRGPAPAVAALATGSVLLGTVGVIALEVAEIDRESRVSFALTGSAGPGLWLLGTAAVLAVGLAAARLVAPALIARRRVHRAARRPPVGISLD